MCSFDTMTLCTKMCIPFFKQYEMAVGLCRQYYISSLQSNDPSSSKSCYSAQRQPIIIWLTYEVIMNTLSWWTPCRKYSSPPVCPASLDEQRKLLRTMRDSTTAVLHMVPFKLSHDKERKEIERDRVRQRQEKLKRERQRDRECVCMGKSA